MAFLKLDVMKDAEIFKRCIERPIKDGDPAGTRALQVLMAATALRRTKDTQIDGRPLVALPEKRINLVTVRQASASWTNPLVSCCAEAPRPKQTGVASRCCPRIDRKPARRASYQSLSLLGFRHRMTARERELYDSWEKAGMQLVQGLLARNQ